MKNISALRLVSAIVILIIGAVLATQAAGVIAQVIVMIVAGLISLSVIILAEETGAQPEFVSLEREREKLVLKGRNAAYQDIIDPITDPILLIRNAKVSAANPAAKKLLGNHIMGEDVRVAIRHPAAADRLANPVAIHSGDPILLVGVGSAEQRWELRIHGLKDGLKLVQLSDQSSRYAAERMRTDFVANASHELRTPLAAIKGFLETLEDPKAGKDDETRARFLKIMLQEAERMQRLIHDLMSLSRIEAEKYQLPEDPVDLGKLIHEVKDFYLTSRDKADTEFIITLSEKNPVIAGDYSQLSQLFHNLVANAYKYSRPDTPVTVTISPNRSGAMFQVTVSDQGEGIAPEHLPRLTERFYRIDKGRSKAIGGTGLGLAIVKHITERHGGRMEISSKSGVGTSVSIFLPVMTRSTVSRSTVKNDNSDKLQSRPEAES